MLETLRRRYLHRWLFGSYAIPVTEDEEEDERRDDDGRVELIGRPILDSAKPTFYKRGGHDPKSLSSA